MTPIAHTITNTICGPNCGHAAHCPECHSGADDFSPYSQCYRCGYTGNPVCDDCGSETIGTRRYEIDEAMLGYDWTDDDSLESFASALQDVLGDRWEIVAITDSVNGARNYDDDDRKVELPIGAWDAAWDVYEVPRCRGQ